MLCTSCQHKPHCVPAQLAQEDAALAHMLEQLKRCGMHRYPLHQRLWAWVRSQWRRLSQVLTTQLNRFS